MVVGGGGGREVLALRRLGYEVDGFECDPGLVACANELLAAGRSLDLKPQTTYLPTYLGI